MKVAIIGNGKLEIDRSSLIDDCDYVIRMNLCQGFGGHYGVKLDCLALCNTGIVALEVMSPHCNHFIPRAKRILLTRNPALYTEIGDNFKDTNLYAIYTDYSHKATRPEYNHAVVRWVDYEFTLRLHAKLAQYSDERFIMPSTGMRVIEEVIHSPQTFNLPVPVSQIYVAGFTYEGWPGHPWRAERALADHYVAEGLIERL